MPPDVADAKGAPTREQLVEVIFALAAHYFPRLAEDDESSKAPG